MVDSLFNEFQFGDFAKVTVMSIADDIEADRQREIQNSVPRQADALERIAAALEEIVELLKRAAWLTGRRPL